VSAGGPVVVVGVGTIGGASGQVALESIPWKQLYLLIQTEAVRSTTLELTGLARNAVIRKLDVELTAKAADLTPLSVAEIRTTPGIGHILNVVVDFGTLVTISGIQTLDAGVGVYLVRSWNGTSFNATVYQCPLKNNQYTADASTLPGDLKPASPSDADNAVFASEVKTEKLQIQVLTTLAPDKAAEKLRLQLPDAPSGLDLVTDAGLRLFNQVSPVIRTASQQEVNANGWNQDYKRIVPLAPLLAPLANDPVARDPLPIKLTLSSRVPGVLKIEEVPGRDVAWLERMPLGPDSKRELVFAEEGLAQLDLPIDAATYKSIESARFIAIGKPGPARVQPPIGPEPNSDLDLVITPSLAMACQLPLDGLAIITGVRLAFAAGPEGAEVKVIALDERDAEPGPPIEGAGASPVTLPPGTTAAAAPWTTFELQAPIDLAQTPRPWIAILVARGRVAWAMGQYGSPGAALAVRRGPPGGPWVKLPSMFQRSTGFLDRAGLPLDLTRLGARVRSIGTAPANAPIAPYRFAITAASALPLGKGAGVAVTPSAKGVAIDFRPSSALAVASGVRVQVVSHVADTLTLRDLDVTLTK
jgi:hypothetical protein